jgi:hypothetical protein
VYVARSDQTVEMRKVDVVANQRGLALLGKGLKTEEMVVADGQLRLSPGATYQALPAKGNAAEATNVASPAAAGSASGAAPAVSAAPSAASSAAPAPAIAGGLSATASR